LKVAPFAETKVSWFGRSSQITTFFAFALPVFFQMIVKPTVPPALTVGDEACLTSDTVVLDGTLAEVTGVLCGVTGGVGGAWRHT